MRWNLNICTKKKGIRASKTIIINIVVSRAITQANFHLRDNFFVMVTWPGFITHAQLQKVSEMACVCKCSFLDCLTQVELACFARPLTKATSLWIAIRILYRLEAENCSAERFIRLVAARCVHVAGKADAHHRWVSLAHLVHVADGRGSGWSQSVGVTLCVATHVSVCVCICSVNYPHTSRSVTNEPLNLWT